MAIKIRYPRAFKLDKLLMSLRRIFRMSWLGLALACTTETDKSLGTVAAVKKRVWINPTCSITDAKYVSARDHIPSCSWGNPEITWRWRAFPGFLSVGKAFFGDARNSSRWPESRTFWVTWQNARQHIPFCCLDQFFLRTSSESSQSSIFGFHC